MRTIRVFPLALAGLFLAGAASVPARAQEDYVGPAARLSAALGGSLGDGMRDAGSMGHGPLMLASERRLGRGEAFRRRVAGTQLSAGAQRPSR
jgi:hypothetical protein